MAQRILYEQVKVTPTASFMYKYFNVSIEDNMPLHSHPEWELSYIVEANGLRLVGGTTEIFEMGELILLTPKVSHCWICNQEKDNPNQRIKNITIQFNNELLEKIAEFPEMSGVITSLLTHKHALSILGRDKDRITELLFEMKECDTTRQYIKFLEILRILSQLAEFRKITFSNETSDSASVKSTRIEKVYRYIATRYTEKITLSEIASVAYMSETSFCAFFKEATRHTFSDFLSEYRIEAAVKLMITTNLSIAEISHQVGFNDTPHFNRMFKKIKGCSPKKYIKRI